MDSNSSQQLRAGEAHAQGQAMTEDWLQSAKDSTTAARDNMDNAAQTTRDAAQSTKDAAQQHKDESASFFQQTGEQMMNMAQGAVDTVKNTLGVGEHNSNQNKK